MVKHLDSNILASDECGSPTGYCACALRVVCLQGRNPVVVGLCRLNT